jgi:hypothetical protein
MTEDYHNITKIFTTDEFNLTSTWCWVRYPQMAVIFDTMDGIRQLGRTAEIWRILEFQSDMVDKMHNARLAD